MGSVSKSVTQKIRLERGALDDGGDCMLWEVLVFYVQRVVALRCEYELSMFQSEEV